MEKRRGDQRVPIGYRNDLASAPYLAIRTLRQLADDEGDEAPLAAETLRRDTYMDDVLSGAATVEEARRLRLELT